MKDIISIKSNRETMLTQMNMLRGLFAIEIVIGHAVRQKAGILLLLGEFMICSVAFFFFVSAYGLVLQSEKKESYLNWKFLKRKILYLLMLAVLVNIINLAIDYLTPYDLNYCNHWNTLPVFFINTNWYLWQQMIFYILFWIGYRFIHKYRIAFITITTISLVTVFYFMGMKETWLASSFSFFFGIIVAEYYEKFILFMNQGRGKIVIIILALFGASSKLFHTENLLSMVVMRNTLCIAVVMIVMFVAQINWIGDNIVTKFLTKYSLGIYLMQFVWLRLVEYLPLNYWMRIVFAVPVTIISGVIVSYPFKWIKKLAG